MNRLPDPPNMECVWPMVNPLQQRARDDSTLSLLPRISIVTPSYNQGEYIEETIRSVLLQDYPNFEYIIIDGGSTDNSLSIIEKYAKWITYWISEPDEGQSYAINKGFKRANGSIYAYINSDDLYEPGALFKVAKIFSEDPNQDLVVGDCSIFNKDVIVRNFQPRWPDDLAYFLEKTFSSTFAQPSAFWSRQSYNEVGGFDERLHYCFDRDFFLRLGLSGIAPVLIEDKLSRFRDHSESKTSTQVKGFHKDTLTMITKHYRACRIDETRKREIVRHVQGEIDYIEVFEKWRHSGRSIALMFFLSMIARNPFLLFKRKILGQIRRLLFFQKKSVAELQGH